MVAVEILGPFLSLTAVPSSIFILNFGLHQSRSEADGDVDVEMAMEDVEVGDGGCSLDEGRQYLLSCRAERDIKESSWNKNKG